VSEQWTDEDSLLLIQMRPLQATRHEETAKAYDTAEDLIEEERYQEATGLLDHMRDVLGTSVRIVQLQTRIDRIRILGRG
jgi:hypothetical protein